MATVNKKKKNLFEIDRAVSLTGNLMLSIVCFALILPVFVKNMHVGYPYVLACCGIQLISILRTVWNVKDMKPAICIFPTLAFNDILIYFVLFAANVLSSHRIREFSDVLKAFFLSGYFRDKGFKTVFIITLVALVLAFLISRNHSDVFFSVVFSMESIVLSLLYIWRGASKLSYGRTVMAATLIVSLVWLFICTYFSAFAKGEKRNTSFYSLIFSVITFVFNSYLANGSLKGLNGFFKLPKLLTDAAVRKMYPWWLVIIMTVGFLACGTVLGLIADNKMEDKIKSYIDAKLFYASGILAFLSKIILSTYFSYSIVLYVSVLLFIYWELMNDIGQITKKKENKGLYDFEDLLFSGFKSLYVVICFVFIINISEGALYLTLPVALIIMIMLYRLIRNFFRKEILEEEIGSVLQGLPKNYHGTVVLLSILLTATLAYHYRFSTAVFIILGIAWAVPSLVFACLKRKLPAHIDLPEIKTAKWAIVVSAVVICIAVTGTSGAKTKMDFNEAARSTTISVFTNKRATVKAVEYKWSNSLIFDGYQLLTADKRPAKFKKQKEKISEKKNAVKIKIPVEGECLTVRVTDSNGIKTTKTLWYPTWFDSSR